MQHNPFWFLNTSGPRSSCFRNSQTSNPSASNEADVTSRVRHYCVQLADHLHVSRWLHGAKQYEVVHARALLPPILWLSLVVRGWHAPALPSSTRLTRSSTTTMEWKMKIESPSRLAPELVGLLNLRIISLALHLIATMLSE